VLGVRDTRFTVNGEPTFLLGMSYYGGLGAPEEFVRRDLDDLKRHGFNWVRVWATWGAFDRDVSAVDAEGRPREPFLGRLK
jgi:beta-galactosidase GanA